MKKYLSLLVALAVTLFSFSSFAFTPPDKPADGWYVLDQAGKLSTDQVKQLNSKIENLNKTTKNEYAVAILSTLDGGNIEDAAQATFRSWGIGKKGLNNGVFLVISVGERKTRIQTGKGAEGDLPDLLCNDILSKTLKPQLKAGKWYDGVNDTLDAIAGHMETRAKKTDAKADTKVDAKTDGSTSATPTTTPNASCGISTGPGPGTLFLLVLVAGGALVYFVRRSKKAAVVRAQARAELDAEWERSLRSESRVRDEERARAMAREREREVATARTFVTKPTVPVPVVLSSGAPRVPRPAGVPVTPTVKSSGLSTAEKVGLGVAGAAVVATVASELLRKREEDAARRRREEADADADRRRREDDSSSYTPSVGSWDSGSSSSSWDSGSSSGGWDSGGSGFGGGDSGGGGSSGDF